MTNSVAKKILRENILIGRKAFDIYNFDLENEIIVRNVKLVIDSLHKNFGDGIKKTLELNSHSIEIIDASYILGMYLPLQGEPDLTKIILYAKSAVCLPKMYNNRIKYVSYQLGDPIEKSVKNFKQPVSNMEVMPKILLIPGLAFSIKGYRLGFGFGHYDQYFKDNSYPCIKIGVCFDSYLFEYLPIEAHDVKFNYIITDKIILNL